MAVQFETPSISWRSDTATVYHHEAEAPASMTVDVADLRFISRCESRRYWIVKLPIGVPDDEQNPRVARFRDADYGGSVVSRQEALSYRDERWALTGLPLHAPVRRAIEVKLIERKRAPGTYDWVGRWSEKLANGRLVRHAISRSYDQHGEQGRALVERLLRQKLEAEAHRRRALYTRPGEQKDRAASLENALRRLRALAVAHLPGSVDLQFVAEALGEGK